VISRNNILKFGGLVFGSAIIFAFCAIVYSYLATPIYRAETVLLPVTLDESQASARLPAGLGGLASLASFGLGNSSSKVEALATLVSRSFVSAFIENNNLLPVLFAEDWNNNAGTWIDVAPSESQAYEFFLDDVLHIVDDSLTGLVVVRVRWSDSETAASWANRIVARLNREMRKRAIDDANKSMSFLKDELTRTNILGVQLSINSLMEKQVNRIMLANVNEQFAFRIIDPAFTVDEDQADFPNRPLLASVGFVFGFLMAVAFLFIRSSIVVTVE